MKQQFFIYNSLFNELNRFVINFLIFADKILQTILSQYQILT